MKVKEIAKQEVLEKKETIVEYSSSEIETLLLNDLKSKGICPINNVCFYVKCVYKTDEWGMNGHYAGEFLGAEIQIEKQQEDSNG